MTSVNSFVNAVASAAADWREDDHSSRRAAIQHTLDAPNRWTEQALDHALNRWMQRLTREGVTRWLEGATLEERPTVAVVHGDDSPFSGVRSAIAVWALGGHYVGVLPDGGAALLPAFAEAVQAYHSDLPIEFAGRDEALDRADAVVAAPVEEAARDTLVEACEAAGVPAERRHLRGPTYSVGLVDGHESEDEMGRLAEDMLLYEGKGRRRLGILWAPVDHPPDNYLEAMAGFRGLFPAHEDTPGTLQMQQAFLEAQDQPHAYAEGMEFLLSRGEPALQKPGHVRWTEYEALDALDAWWREHREEVYAIVARPHLHDQCPDDWPLRTPGGVHIPPLDDAEGTALADFLRGLSG